MKFKNAFTYFVQKNPISVSQSLEQRPVAPSKLPSVAALDGQIGPKQVRYVRLVRQVDPNDPVARDGGQGLDERRLAHAGAAFHQDGLADLERAQETSGVAFGRRGFEAEAGQRFSVLLWTWIMSIENSILEL